MKQLFRHTASLFRAVLLFGAAALFNILPTQAQTAEQLSAMPNAFETKTPVIDDGEYYYIQFYYDRKISYLTDRGTNKRAATKDFLPSNNRLWTLVNAGDDDATHFKLKSKEGRYIGFVHQPEGASGDRYVCLESADDSRTATFTLQTSEDGYNFLDLHNNSDQGTNGLLGRPDNHEWIDQLSIIRNNDSGKNNSRMHFVQLKSNVAYIIYYRQEGIDNNDPNSEATRHYLTYSGTDNTDANNSNEFFAQSTVSSRKSVLPSDKSLYSFPTAAAYHKDGLWTIEPTDPTNPNSDFYIKKYGGTEQQYLIAASKSWWWYSVLGGKDEVNGRYNIDDPTASRYSRVRNIRYNANSLTASLFHKWNDHNANSTQSDESYTAESHLNEERSAGNLVIGDASVRYLYYADLTDNTRMVIEGTSGVKLRVLLNRLEVGNGGGDGNGGAMIEKLLTIGEGGKAELDLSDLSYVHLNAIKLANNSPYGTITSIRLLKPGSNSDTRYLNYGEGDGWEAYQWADANHGNTWYAGFYPVEVPNPNQDSYYRVLAGFNNGYNVDGKMLTESGWLADYSDVEGERQLLILSQEDDYQHFYLKSPDGKYIKLNGGTTDNKNEGECLTITSLLNKFFLKWYYVDPILSQKEIDVSGREVIHKMSYLKQYTDQFSDLKLDKYGMSSNKDSDWKYGNGLQKTNHFEITHYIKKGKSINVEFPTVLGLNNDHRYFQRFFTYYDEDETSHLKEHISLDLDGYVQYYLYKNGLVTGEKLYWDNTTSLKHSAQHRFRFTNVDGDSLTVAADVSRYSDIEYKNTSSKLSGDLVEPSLTMRYIYFMKDAKEMATKLTACTSTTGKWLEEKEFHFPSKQVKYDNNKWVGYRGEFIGLRHVFSDYWVFDDPNYVKIVNENGKDKAVIDEAYIKTKVSNPNMTSAEINDYLDNHLISAVNEANNGGLIYVDVVPGNTEIWKGGYNATIFNARIPDPEDNNKTVNGLRRANLDGVSDYENDYEGFYYYDKMYDKDSYGDSRFVVFRYPEKNGVNEVSATGPNNKAYVNVYLKKDENTKYQLAQFTLIFDEDSETLPWTSVNGSDEVKGTARDPRKLLQKAGKPIAKVTFDFPESSTYHFPVGSETRHDNGNGNDDGEGGTIANSSPVPLNFDHTNYSFDGDNCNWGSYAMVSQKESAYGNQKHVYPVNHNDYGYGMKEDGTGPEKELQPEDGLQNGFLYIDASEQPGDICAIDFQGEFCTADQLICTGWISGSNKYNDTGFYRCPGGITLTVKGEDAKGETKTIRRFCPGQCYELDNGTGTDGREGADHVVWQQFYFEFSTDQKYERYWLEVNNNCVSSNGGDFMLDNIEVYTIVPEVTPDLNTPLCVKRDGENIVTEMNLLKLDVNFNKLISSAKKDPITGVVPDELFLGFVFLDKVKFLTEFKSQISYAGTIEQLAIDIEAGIYDNEITGNESSYKAAFEASLLREPGSTKIWKSTDTDLTTNKGAGVMYFQWKKNFESNELYSFYKAVNKEAATFRYTDAEDARFLIFNGNYPELPWRTNTDYYIIPSNNEISSYSEVYETFNLCSECTKASVFHIEPPLTVLGLEKSEDSHDYVVCEGQIPTLVTELKGFDFYGNEVPMQDINYDWWLGDPSSPATLATLDNYHDLDNGNGVKLDQALSTLRIYYPDATDLDGIIGNLEKNPNPKLTIEMVNFLKELVDAGQLVLHQRSVSVPSKPVSDVDPYFYLVACPIHDEQFKRALNPNGPANIITNSLMESYETESYYVGTPSTGGAKIPATITAGVGKYGSRGIKISTTAEGNSNAWDSQFIIRANEVIPVNTTFHLEFDYRARTAATVSTQSHAEPGNYIHYEMLGNLDFTTEWQHYSSDITVKPYMGNGEAGDKNNSFQSIAFNLWETSSANDYYFDNVELTVPKNQYVAYFCDEPQGFRVKVGEKAPTLKTGFVPGENTFLTYDYSAANNALLSIRLAKKEQFETVKHGSVDDAPDDSYCTSADEDKHFLWLPIRNAQTQTADGVVRKSSDYNIYLASTNDPVNDKKIYTAMKKGTLPIIGKIVRLNAINTTGDTHLDEQNDQNRLCIYFTENFEVREGYSYTLSLPFQEELDGDGNASNACDGTILLNLKIVPDYEVWTGAAGNTDWNNDENWRRADGNTAISTTESPDGSKRNNNELYRTDDLPDESPLKDYVTNYTNYRTAKDRIFRKGFAPLYCTHVLIKSNEWGDAPVLYDALDEDNNSELTASPFPNLRDKDNWNGSGAEATATSILRYDMQARHYELWEETYGVASNKGRAGDLIAEMYQVNSCDEIAFQPGAEMLNTHLLNYNNAWVEYKLDNKRWYLLGSPLQGTISGEWYAPKKTAQQKTTYYEPVSFVPRYVKVTNPEESDNPSERGWYKKNGEDYVLAGETAIVSSTDYYYLYNPYDRYNPAIYQRSWDKAKTVLYEVGSTYSTTDDSQTENLGYSWEGGWNNGIWKDPTGETDGTGADNYLDRLGYKSMGGNKANVAIQGIWSNTYNDATVDYANGGFSVMVMNHLKGTANDKSGGESIIRLPKEDTMYDYYEYSQTNADDGGTDTYLVDHSNEQGVQNAKDRAKNRGRLKTDQLLPTIGEGLQTYLKIQRSETATSIYGDRRTYTRVPTRVDENALPMTLQSFSETVPLGESNLGYYLIENPFPCGLDMEEFFKANPKLLKKYWLLTETGQQLVQYANEVNLISGDVGYDDSYDPETVGDWIVTNGNSGKTAFKVKNAVVAPGQGFFVEADPTYTDNDMVVTDGVKTTKIAFNAAMQAQTRYGEPDAGEEYEIVVGTKQVMVDEVVNIDEDGDGITDYTETIQVPKVNSNGDYVVEDITEKVTVYQYKQKIGDGFEYPLKSRITRSGQRSTLPGMVITARRDNSQSSALVMQLEQATNDFLPDEDTETFITSDLEQVPTVYTLCGRLATTINSIHDFRSLPVGVESNSVAPCTLTFKGVEMLGDSIGFYDALEQKLTPLKSGMTVSVSGQTQNRYYIVRSLIQEEAAAETHLQIFTEGLTAKVIASTAEPITSVRCYDTAGRLIHSATPQTSEYSFTLPTAGIYIIDAGTDNDHKTVKVMVK